MFSISKSVCQIASSYMFYERLSRKLLWHYFKRKEHGLSGNKILMKPDVVMPHKLSDSVKNVTVCSEKDLLEITTDSGYILHFPYVWLRDNCQCSLCFNNQLQSRTIDWRHFDITIQPTSFSHTSDVINIKWSDGHESKFTFRWLEERNFKKDNQEKWLSNTYRFHQVPWNAAEFPNILKKFNYQDIMESDSHLYHWLESLSLYGIAVINSNIQEDNLPKLANRVSFAKKTHYGEQFVVRNKPDSTNLAYLRIPLQMHSDMPYYEYKPGINMLHCLIQSPNGGENMFVDCLHLCNHLKANYNDVYEILSKVPVEWTDIGEEDAQKFHSIFRDTVICNDQWGTFSRINYNQWQRDSHFSVSIEDAISWYKALALFTELLYNHDNMITYKSKPGEILTFDNIRLLHARAAYEDEEATERHIIGTYLDWDIVYSRIRALKNNVSKMK